MTTADTLNIERFIPSETYKAFLKENHIELSPKQKAKIIYRSNRPKIEKWDALKELISSLHGDDELRKYLETWVSYEENFIEREQLEINGCIYRLEEYDPDERYGLCDIGMFATLSDAERIGRKTGHDFRITRHRCRNLSEEDLGRFEKQIEEKGYLDTEEDQAFHYNCDGNFTALDRMYEAGGKDNLNYLQYQEADEYLDSIFADLPLNFQNGDVIQSACRRRHGDCYGIIHVFPDRKKQISRLLSKGYNPDDEEFVEFMDKNGQFEHDHILVTELEHAELESIPEQQRGVIDAASRLVKGTGSIDELQYDIIQMSKSLSVMYRGNSCAKI